MSYSGNYKDVGIEEYRFIWVSKRKEDKRGGERDDLGALMLLLKRLYLNLKVTGGF